MSRARFPLPLAHQAYNVYIYTHTRAAIHVRPGGLTASYLSSPLRVAVSMAEN